MVREQIEIRTADGTVFFVEGACLHRNTAPVESAGCVVAVLCLDCDAQLPVDPRFLDLGIVRDLSL